VGAEQFRYDGKRVLVVGGATGMGAAAAQAAAALGGEVVVLDVADVTYPVAQAIQVDLRDQASVDAAIGAVDGPIDAVFACAGVADGTPGIMLINFVAQRHLIEALRDSGKLAAGGGIVMISSVAGLMWQQQLGVVLDFLGQPDWDAMAKWVAEHDGTDSYAFSKMAINAYVAQEGFRLLQKGVRINAVLPGPTDTPLARANADTWLGFGADYREKAGIEALSPEQVANVMVFLASPAASGVNGVSLVVDAGHVGAGVTGSYDDPIIKMLAGVQ
jgi:NAD(P)-dependent dehydrogenase (short-subunit alcohol dehydrogenase family)